MRRPYMIWQVMSTSPLALYDAPCPAEDLLAEEQEAVSCYAEALEAQQADAGFLTAELVGKYCPDQLDLTAHPPAFPDQLYTFVGDCSSRRQLVAFIPEGGVAFSSPCFWGNCLIALLAEGVSADYLDYLEARQISYTFAGEDGQDLARGLCQLSRDFGLTRLTLHGGIEACRHLLRAGLLDEVCWLLPPALARTSQAPSALASLLAQGKCFAEEVLPSGARQRRYQFALAKTRF